MGSTDGSIVGTTKLLDNGPDTERLVIVFVAEGFQASQLSTFHAACSSFIHTLHKEPWLHSLMSAFNFYRLDVASTDAGIDDPVCSDPDNAGSGVIRATYFDGSFCSLNLHRLLSFDVSLIWTEVGAAVPEWDYAAVIVNSPTLGGTGGARVFSQTLHPQWQEGLMHELGHSVFDLDDEYDYRATCTGEPGQDHAPGGDPEAPNVTTVTDLASIKWRPLLDTPPPNLPNSNCSSCNTASNPFPEGDVGLFEGARYYHCDMYRPTYSCRMRTLDASFCRVCIASAMQELSGYYDTPILATEASTVTLVRKTGESYLRASIEIVNAGTVNVTGIDPATDSASFLAFPVISPTLAPQARGWVDVVFVVSGFWWFSGATLTIKSNAPDLSVQLRVSIFSILVEVVRKLFRLPGPS